MSRVANVLAVTLLVGGVGACAEESPTSIDPEGVPFEIRTVEIELPWSEFGTGVESFDGFGTPSDIGLVILADGFMGVLDSRALVRFRTFPSLINVRNAEGTLVTDTVITFRAGRIIADAVVSQADSIGTWEFQAGALTQPWDVASATWESAIDSVGVTVPWDTPGADPVRLIGAGALDLADGADSVVIELDAETLAEWQDSAADRSMRFDITTENERVRFSNFRLRLDIGSSIDTDTTVVREVDLLEQTFIYTPSPDDPDGVIRIGGAPAWRTVFGLDVPTVLTGPEALCEVAGCPFRLTPEALNRASLVLRTRESPVAFQPQDSVFLDTRPVLAPDALPKSPLGNSFIGNFTLGPDAFGDAAGEPFEFQITSFVRALVDPEADGSEPSTIALLGTFEPLDIALAEFAGPDEDGAPRLRLLVTVSDQVTYR